MTMNKLSYCIILPAGYIFTAGEVKPHSQARSYRHGLTMSLHPQRALRGTAPCVCVSFYSLNSRKNCVVVYV